MADISKVRMLNGTEYNYKDAKARSDIEGLKADLDTLANVTPIPDNSDLNDYTETGLYSIENTAYNILNYPDTNNKIAGTLEVFALSTGYIQQIMTKGSGRIYARVRYGNGVWNDWVQITRNSEHEFSRVAKNELVELLKHVTWKDSEGEAHFEGLVTELDYSMADYEIIAGKGTKSVAITETPQDVQYFVNDSIAKRALIVADTGEHCLTLQDGTATIYYPIKIPQSVKKIWFENLADNNLAVSVSICYYDSSLAGYRRFLRGNYELGEIGVWKRTNIDGSVWKLDISDYNNGNLYIICGIAKSYSSESITDADGNQHVRAILGAPGAGDVTPVGDEVQNVVLRMI